MYGSHGAGIVISIRLVNRWALLVLAALNCCSCTPPSSIYIYNSTDRPVPVHIEFRNGTENLVLLPEGGFPTGSGDLAQTLQNLVRITIYSEVRQTYTSAQLIEMDEGAKDKERQSWVITGQQFVPKEKWAEKGRPTPYDSSQISSLYNLDLNFCLPRDPPISMRIFNSTHTLAVAEFTVTAGRVQYVIPKHRTLSVPDWVVAADFQNLRDLEIRFPNHGAQTVPTEQLQKEKKLCDSTAYEIGEKGLLPSNDKEIAAEEAAFAHH